MPRPRTEKELLITKSVVLSTAEIETIQTIAKREGTSFAAVVRRLVRQGLRGIERKA